MEKIWCRYDNYSMHNLDFRLHLLTEDKSYLGKRVGDILNGLQDLSQNAPSMGTREVNKNAETIVNQIRRIVKTNWPQDDKKHLESLQKIGVAIMRAIEEKGDLESTLTNSTQEMEQTMKSLGVPINDLGTPDNVAQSPDDASGTAEPQGSENPDGQKQPDSSVPPETQPTGGPAAPAPPPPAAGSATPPQQPQLQ